MSEITDVFKKIKNDGLLFRSNMNEIAKHFLSKFLSLSVFQSDFQMIKDSYLQNIEFYKILTPEEEDEKYKKLDQNLRRLYKEIEQEQKDEVTKACQSENEFYSYICKKYLDLVKEPRQELLSAFLRARADICEIDETLEDIRKQLDDITKKNDAGEIQEKKPILYYYQEHNEIAKEGVLKFLKDDIDNYALNNCYNNSLMGSFFDRIPYSYHWNPKSYVPQYPNDMHNKFADFPLPQMRKIESDYVKDKPAFNAFLAEYIKNDDIVFQLNEMAKENHMLEVRKDIISEATQIYQNGAKIMFANAVPTIIEGVLHDLCLLIGENENELLQKGFQNKLDKLKDVLSYELFYEYYAFRFRLFRNKVAHGRLAKSDVEELSDLLLLDLFHICKLTNSMKLKLNQKRFLIAEINENLTKPDFKQILGYIILDKTEIPAFYNLSTEIDEVEKIINGNGFWDYLEKEAKAGDVGKHGTYTILKILGSRKPVDERCAKIFRTIGIKSADKSLSDIYIKDLVKNY